MLRDDAMTMGGEWLLKRPWRRLWVTGGLLWVVSSTEKDVVMAEAEPVLSGGISGAMTGPEAGLTGFP